ncbi:MAG TPA: BTAD domain-containing putative transcriptional regulator [Actinomycetes bacterium]
MEFLVLGPLEVRGSARPLGPPGGKQAGLLALLALHANQVVATDRLIHALWGERPPPSARQALQNHVSSLRKLLAGGDGDAVLRTRDPGYVLAVEQERVDAFRFERLADAGRQALADGDPADAAALLRQALALWRGPALPELAEWAASWPELTALADRRISVTEDRVEADLALGRHRELVGELDLLVGQHPLREQLRGQQMLALYRSGRQADALAAYRDARRVLVEGLGFEPTVGLQRLEQAILAQDPALDLLAPLRAGGARATEAAGRTPVWRQGRSLPDGDGGTLSVLAEVVKAEAGILDTDSAERAGRRLAQAVAAALDRPGGSGATPGDGDEAAWVLEHLRRLVGLGGGADPQQRVSLHADRRGEVFAAWRRFLYRLAARQPLVLAIEDLQWADDALLDFLDGLTDPGALDRPGPAPLLVLATARPELAERRPDWGAGRRTAATLALAPLDEEETGHLLEALLARHGLATGVDPALVGRVGGNPLFAEEYVRLLRDQLAGTVAIPETVHAIIAARLDALPAAEKAVLQDVAVLGRAGWPGAVAAIGGYDRAWLDECLRALTAKEFVHRAGRSTVAGEREYRFRHVLVREVAYGQLPRAARAGRHRRAAAWLESLAEERLEDRAEMLASHYQWALRFARAAGRVDPELTERARLALRAAGERAVGLGVFPTAARYYTEALALWPEDHPDRPRLRFRAAEARFYTQGTVGAQPPGLGGDAGGELRDARDELLAADDPGGAAEAEMLLAYLALDQGRPSEWKPHLRGALDLARKAPPSRSKAWALSHCAIHGLATGEVADASAAGREALSIARQLGLAELEATARSAVGALRVDQGDLGGVADLERARAALAKLNSPDLINSHFLLGFAHSRLGDPAATMAVMMAARATANRIGSVYLVRWMKFQGAAGEYWAGMWDEAVATADEFEAAAASLGHHYLGVVCHASRAYIRLARGDGAGAVADAVAATQLAERWQDGHMPHIARTAHARTLLATGRTDEAAAVAEALLAKFRPGPLPVPIGVDLGVVLAGLGHPAAVLDRRGVTGSAWLDALRAFVDGDAAGAADVYARIGSRPDEAYARMEAGRRLLAAGAPERARPQLTAALDFWRQVGAGAYAGEAEALLAIGAARA